jgi:hypothetical protein
MTTIYSKSNNNSTVNSEKKNVMKFTGLTPTQKDKLLKGSLGVASIAGAGLLITSLSGFDEKPEESISSLVHDKAPVSQNVNDNMSFAEAFITARQEVGAGGVFTWQGKEFNTYYKEEWNSMSPEQKNEYIASLGEGVGQEFTEHNEVAACPVEIPTDFEMAQGVTDDMSFSDAFETARNECGSDGLFVWHGNTYNTFTKEEWDGFSDSDKLNIANNIHNDTDWNNIIVDDTPQVSALVEENIGIINGDEIIAEPSIDVADNTIDLTVLDSNGNEVELVEGNEEGLTGIYGNPPDPTEIIVLDDPKNEIFEIINIEDVASIDAIDGNTDLSNDINLDDFEIDENLA